MALLKIARLLHSRNQLLHNRLVGEDVKVSLWLRGVNTFAGSSATRQNNAADESLANRVFAPYSVFKGKAALSAEPRRPTFIKLDSGGVKLDRRGVIMLTFWPSVGERKYDWDKRQLFALSPTEIGSLISLGTRDSCEFFHDPSMLSSNAGQVRKTLSIKPNADGTGYFVSLNVVNNILKTNDRFAVPVTTAEFAVMRTAFSFALPHIMGWNRFTNQPSESASQSPPKVVGQVMDSEWDR